MSTKRILAWCASAALAGVACSAPSASPPADRAAAGTPPFSPDEDGLRGKLAGCLGLSLDTALAWLIPEKIGGISEAQRACLVAATTCDDVQHCLGVEPGPCPEMAECDGNIAKLCWALRERPEVVEKQDCSHDRDGNHTCFVTSGHGPDEAYAQCGAGSCRVDSCDGDVLVQCINGVAVRNDCTRAGKGCVETTGVAFCGFEEACTESRCDDDIAVVCDFGHVVFRQSCSEIFPEAGCVEEHGAAYCGAPLAGATTCEGAPDVCIGDRAQHCSQGIWIEVDCSAVGASCVEQAPGWVACSAPPELLVPESAIEH
jgi:hypothetical protein